MSNFERIVFKWLIVLFLIAAFVVSGQTGCSHKQKHMQEHLQRQNPDCHVTEDLEIVCKDIPTNERGEE